MRNYAFAEEPFLLGSTLSKIEKSVFFIRQKTQYKIPIPKIPLSVGA
ncbi:hypothetical protein COO91_11052 (plasmid) [Nostoc flagelliforme CCNUN1]|uniref:Uncharacterized protein n=1 Tax=Nostoc flagelliforme CCNUN1 TaxID=2038116 RepID=A0A2K8TCP7_9NOSO|nr:hypothetical protein COO91_10485 [Nostoc flagelliforme CCNUN1]AUB44805.1 hypothetical protein COO91_11052 [Nostoc flagelliforme CCNUN1]